jgi:hypothetical protein
MVDHVGRMRAHMDTYGTQVTTFCHTVAIARGLALVWSLPPYGFWGERRDILLSRYFLHMERLNHKVDGYGERNPPTWIEFDAISAIMIDWEILENAPRDPTWRSYTRMWERDTCGRLRRIDYDV